MARKFTEKEIEEGVRKIIEETIPKELDSLSASFTEDLEADSLDLVELAMGLEQHFGLDPVNDEEFAGVSTPQKAIEFVTAKLYPMARA